MTHGHITECYHGVPGNLACGACQKEASSEEAIEDTLAERGARYGDFVTHAKITQRLKWAMKDETKWQQLEDDQKEALEMVAHKIGRILNGDPNYHDSWHDAIGYIKLVADRLPK